MDVSVGERWEDFIARVVREGLRLVEERESRLTALRRTLDASIAAGGHAGEAEIDAALDAKAAELEARGFRA